MDTQDTLNSLNPQPSTYHVPQAYQAGVCRHGFRKAFVNSGGVKFAPRQFLIPTKYMTENETDIELQKMDDLLNGIAENHANLDPTLIETSRATNIIMSGLDANWRNQDYKLADLLGSSSEMVINYNDASSELVPVWRYFGSIEGTFRVWPNTQLAQAYDPAQRGWFAQALRGEEGTTFISTPYIDAFGMGYLITVSRTINYNNNGQIAGVIGTDYFVSQFGESVLQSYEKYKAIIIDSTGALIYHSDFYPNNYGGFFPYVNVKFYDSRDKSISGSEPLTLSQVSFGQEIVGDLLLNAGLPTFACHDVTSLKTKKTFDIDKYLKSQQRDEVIISKFRIKRLPGTNAYIMSPRDHTVSVSVSHGSIYFKVLHNAPKHNYFGGYKSTPEKYGGYPVVIRPEWATVYNQYDQCENKFFGGDAVPACQAPGPSLDDSYLGKFDQERGFKYQKIEGYQNCFDYMNNWKDYFLYKEDDGKSHYNNKAAGEVFRGLAFFVVIIVAIIVFKNIAEEETEENPNQNLNEPSDGVIRLHKNPTQVANNPQQMFQNLRNFKPVMHSNGPASPFPQQQFGGAPQPQFGAGAQQQPQFNININTSNKNENKY